MFLTIPLMSFSWSWILSRFPRCILLLCPLSILQHLKSISWVNALRLQISYFSSYFWPLILTSIDYSYLKQWTQCLPNGDFSTSIVIYTSNGLLLQATAVPFFFLINVFKLFICMSIDSWIFVLYALQSITIIIYFFSQIVLGLLWLF